MSEEGRIVGERYRLEAHLDSGTMGEVYRARHTITQQTVAVKLLFPYLARRESDVIRFKREARLAASLEHPNIVQMLDAGIDGDRYYLAMEFLEGETLEDVLANEPSSRAEVLGYLVHVLDALRVAHEAGIVHRDIKPANIFLTAESDGSKRVKLLDFGIARQMGGERATLTGTTLGTPIYMSPEQAMRPEEVHVGADVWSVGVILYELLTGARPFTANSPTALLVKTVSEPHVPVSELAPNVPQALVSVVERCLLKDEGERYTDAGALLSALRTVLETREVSKWLGAGDVRVARSAREMAESVGTSEESVAHGYGFVSTVSEDALRRPMAPLFVVAAVIALVVYALFAFESDEAPTPSADRAPDAVAPAPSGSTPPTPAVKTPALAEEAPAEAARPARPESKVVPPDAPSPSVKKKAGAATKKTRARNERKAQPRKKAVAQKATEKKARASEPPRESQRADPPPIAAPTPPPKVTDPAPVAPVPAPEVKTPKAPERAPEPPEEEDDDDVPLTF